MTSKDKNSSKTPPEAKNKHSKADRPEKGDKSAAKDERFKERWLQLNSDVSSALGYWNDITEKYDGKISKDQEQLQEIKCLLKDLQKKIKVFND